MYICDRFFLGGPHTIRGFENRGIGPHSDGQALGAQAYWAGGLHLFTPLPFRPGRGGIGDILRTHLFVNAGNIDNFQFSECNSVSFIPLRWKPLRLNVILANNKED